MDITYRLIVGPEGECQRNASRADAIRALRDFYRLRGKRGDAIKALDLVDRGLVLNNPALYVERE